MAIFLWFCNFGTVQSVIPWLWGPNEIQLVQRYSFKHVSLRPWCKPIWIEVPQYYTQFCVWETTSWNFWKIRDVQQVEFLNKGWSHLKMGETYFGRCLRLYTDLSLIFEILFVFSPQVFDEVLFWPHPLFDWHWVMFLFGTFCQIVAHNLNNYRKVRPLTHSQNLP